MLCLKKELKKNKNKRKIKGKQALLGGSETHLQYSDQIDFQAASLHPDNFNYIHHLNSEGLFIETFKTVGTF